MAQLLKASGQQKTINTMDTALTIKNSSDHETGLAILNNFLAGSGFNYLSGVREVGKLRVIEGVAKGAACIFLKSVMVFDQNGKLIFDAEIENMTAYSREFVRQIVLRGILKMLRDASKQAGKSFDENQAFKMLNKMLENAYYEESYRAILVWAEDMGII